MPDIFSEQLDAGGVYRLLARTAVYASFRELPARLRSGDNEHGDTHDREPAVCPDKFRVDLCSVRSDQVAVREETGEDIHERGAESGHGVSCLAATYIKTEPVL